MTLGFYYKGGNLLGLILAVVFVASGGVVLWYMFKRRAKDSKYIPDGHIIAAIVLFVVGAGCLFVSTIDQKDHDMNQRKDHDALTALTRNYRGTVAEFYSIDRTHSRDQDGNGVPQVHYRLRSGQECFANARDDQAEGWVIDDKSVFCRHFKVGQYPGATPSGQAPG